MTGAILVVLLAVLGITILRIRQLMWLHLFLGLVLIGPLTLKLASTGYRFARYYTRSASYRAKGPPEPVMRAIAPLVVVSTATVFASGILLLIVGPRGRDSYLPIHKASFVIWLCLTGLHVLGRLPLMLGLLATAGAERKLSGSAPGAAGRWLALAGALVAGAVLAIVLVPQFGAWTAHAHLLRDH